MRHNREEMAGEAALRDNMPFIPCNISYDSCLNKA